MAVEKQNEGGPTLSKSSIAHPEAPRPLEEGALASSSAYCQDGLHARGAPWSGLGLPWLAEWAAQLGTPPALPPASIAV